LERFEGVILGYRRLSIGGHPIHGGAAVRSLALFIVFIPPSVVAAQQPSVVSESLDTSIETSPALIPPRPTLGWILKDNQSSIVPAFGDAPLESTETGTSPAVASDGAGNIDGAALVGGVPTGAAVSHYALKEANQATLLEGTTVLLLCGRENNWLRNARGALLPLNVNGEWNVIKPGEWGLSLVSSISPFAVTVGNQWVYANAPPAPPSFIPFTLEPEFPPPGANAQVCVWGFYDTSVKGSKSAPEISVAYDGGPASTPRKLASAVSSGANPMEVMFNQLGSDLGTLFVWQGSEAEPMFQQDVRAAYWNGGLRKRIGSGFETPDWDGLSVTNLDPRPIALGGDAQDNVWSVAYPGFVRTSPFAHYSITTPPGTPFLAVRYELGNFVYRPRLFSISMELDGKYMGYDQPWRQGINLRSIPLPLDGRSHTVDLRNGFTRNDTYSNPTSSGWFGGGGFIDAVAVPRGYKVTVNRPAPDSVALVLSHSVATAEQAETIPYLDQGPESSTAWPVQARAVKAFGTESVVDESYGGELLGNDCPTQKSCTAYIVSIRQAQPKVKVGFVARMLNDFYHGRSLVPEECLPEYEEKLQYLFAAWAAEFPGVPLYVGSDIEQSPGDESKNDSCNSLRLADWRQGIEDTVKSYAARNDANWLHFVDMSRWVPQDELVFDGIHPSTEGQVKICQAVAVLFRQNVECGVPH
jgi:hypothetical protein